jgi:hypothetical protein
MLRMVIHESSRAKLLREVHKAIGKQGIPMVMQRVRLERACSKEVSDALELAPCREAQADWQIQVKQLRMTVGSILAVMISASGWMHRWTVRMGFRKFGNLSPFTSS